MLGLLVRLAVGALLAVAVIEIVVTYLNKDIAQNELRKHNIYKGVVKDIVNSDSVAHIKLDAINEDGEEIEIDIETEEYDSSQIYEGVVIYT